MFKRLGDSDGFTECDGFTEWKQKSIIHTMDLSGPYYNIVWPGFI